VSLSDGAIIAWACAASAWSFLAFGWDKRRAARSGRRVSERHLLIAGALGGWPGGIAAMLLFRHKTAKWSFKFKYLAAMLPSAAAIAGHLLWKGTLPGA
jgi:uncharacterized membrane protein YsdA (DUF1294 family)